MTLMATAQRLMVRWLIPSEYRSMPPKANQAQSHSSRNAPTTMVAMPVMFRIL
jgi:hypothetical protein